MDNSEKAWELIEIEAKKKQERNPEWRWGQTLFNVLYMHYPEVANKIRATKYDCFHVDERVPEFKKRAIELLNN
jgi:hypothetical protein